MESIYAIDSRIAELLRKSEVEKKMADQLKSQSRNGQFASEAPLLQSEIATYTAAADRLRREAIAALAARGPR